MSCYTRRIVF